MQIITGKYRGRKLLSLDTDKTRPTLARVKESLFSMIDSYIDQAVVLDLFAGSGSLGIECISRNAKKVFFCDNNPEAKKVLSKNLERVTEPYEVIIGDFKEALNTFKRKLLKFDLVLLDPPYKSDFGDQAMDFLVKNNMLSKGAIVVYEQESKNLLQKDKEWFIIKKSKNYGLANLTIYEYIGE